MQGKEGMQNFYKKVFNFIDLAYKHISDIKNKHINNINDKNIKNTHIKRINNISNNTFRLQGKMKFILYGIAVILLISTIIGTSVASTNKINESMIAYEVEIDGIHMGVVRQELDFENALDYVKSEVKRLYGHEAAISDNIKFTEVQVKDDNITTNESLIYNIKSQMDMKVKAVAIVINGEEIVKVSDLNIAQLILNEIKTPFMEEGIEYEEVFFSQDVEIIEIATDIAEIRDKEYAINYILRGTDEEEIHEVQKGESMWVIARNYGLTVEDIEKANPNIDPKRLQIGQSLSLIVPRPYIAVRTRQYVELEEAIPFDTEYKKTDSLYKGDKKITVQGVEGKREIKGYIIKENGVEVDREILEEKILSEPTTRVVVEGTTPRPATVATGKFSNPTRGRLTSRFGMRWGSMHNGIDVGAPTGTPIKAADAGKVSFTGQNGTYGNLVIINHENGYQTYYAHCSKILVKKGDRVHKGQHIANVGNTGRSTGPHLHFEIHKNGKPLNPLGFVSY